MQKLVRWGSVSILLGVLVWVIVSWVSAYRQSADQATGNLKLPDNYYGLSITQKSVVVCVDETSNDYRVGYASEYFIKDKHGKEHLVITFSKTALTRQELEDYEKKYPGQYVNLIRSLKPNILFYLQTISKDKGINRVSVYVVKKGAWLDFLKFWKSQFQVKWEMAIEKDYSRDNAKEVETSLMKRFVNESGKSGKCEMVPAP